MAPKPFLSFSSAAVMFRTQSRLQGPFIPSRARSLALPKLYGFFLQVPVGLSAIRQLLINKQRPPRRNSCETRGVPTQYPTWPRSSIPLCPVAGRRRPVRALLRWILRCKRRAAGFFRGMEVHQFQPDAIGIVKVELALAVFADLGVVVVAPGEAVAGGEHFVG